jgi:molecular chaperone DnaJ
MNLQEAYSTLGVSQDISDDELKATYKGLAKQYHPDIYKEDTNRFKTINEAYQLITDHREHPEKYAPPSPFGRGSPFGGGFGINIQDILNNFGAQQDDQRQFNFAQITKTISISFAEAVLGCNRDIEYHKYNKCAKCNGTGFNRQKNDCTQCDGFGRVIQNKNGAIYSMSCNKCYGKNIKRHNCPDCANKGVVDMNVALTIHIPPGAQNGSQLQLRGQGHYEGNSVFGESYSNVILTLKVEPDPELEMIGQDVVSKVNISLLDALIGCKRGIKTVNGHNAIDIPPKSKNKDEIKIDGCGVAGTPGTQRVIINIDYPDNIDKLIETLKG